MRSVPAVPWRFCAVDYHPRPGRALTGSPVHASWDAALAPAMSAGGYALEEESMIDILLEDLALQD
jgi:hypothetical protein